MIGFSPSLLSCDFPECISDKSLVIGGIWSVPTNAEHHSVLLGSFCGLSNEKKAYFQRIHLGSFGDIDCRGVSKNNIFQDHKKGNVTLLVTDPDVHIIMI